MQNHALEQLSTASAKAFEGYDCPFAAAPTRTASLAMTASPPRSSVGVPIEVEGSTVEPRAYPITERGAYSVLAQAPALAILS